MQIFRDHFIHVGASGGISNKVVSKDSHGKTLSMLCEGLSKAKPFTQCLSVVLCVATKTLPKIYLEALKVCK